MAPTAAVVRRYSNCWFLAAPASGVRTRQGRLAVGLGARRRGAVADRTSGHGISVADASSGCIPGVSMERLSCSVSRGASLVAASPTGRAREPHRAKPETNQRRKASAHGATDHALTSAKESAGAPHRERLRVAVSRLRVSLSVPPTWRPGARASLLAPTPRSSRSRPWPS